MLLLLSIPTITPVTPPKRWTFFVALKYTVEIGNNQNEALPKVLVILVRTTGYQITFQGTTGVGKTKLSIQMAGALNGEIVSADSMQVYNVLDLQISTKSPGATYCNQSGNSRRKKWDRSSLSRRGKQCRDRLQRFYLPKGRIAKGKAYEIASVTTQIYDIIARGKLPIIVGGTNQFIEALIWETPLFCGDAHSNIPNIPEADLHALLSSIDPERAEKLHPNDTRKIKRSLEVNNLYTFPHLLIRSITQQGRGTLTFFSKMASPSKGLHPVCVTEKQGLIVASCGCNAQMKFYFRD